MKHKILKNTILSFAFIFTALLFAACGESQKTVQPTPVPTFSSDPTAEPTLKPTEAVEATPTLTPSPSPTEAVHGLVNISKEEYPEKSIPMYDAYTSEVTDGTYEYTVNRNRIFKTSLSDPSDTSEIKINYPIIISYISGYYKTRSGEDGLLVFGECGDGNYYYVGYNLTAEETQLVVPSNGDFAMTSLGGMPCVYTFSRYFSSSVFYPNDDPIAFVYSAKRNVNFYPLDKYLIMVDMTMEDEDEEELWGEEFYNSATSYDIGIFDLKESKFIAKAVIGFDKYLSLSHLPYMENGKLYVSFSDLSDENKQFFEWEYANDPVESSDFSYILVENYINNFSNNLVEGSFNVDDYIYGDVIPELADLRERADIMEEKYGLDIFISDQCKAICGGYFCEAINNRNDIVMALDTMDYELSKYPEGFFEQFKDKSVFLDGIEMYLAGTLKGEENSNTLDYAGGFRTQVDQKIVIYVDITQSEYASTFHHEISHAIETKLDMNNVDETVWNSLNPQHYDGSVPYVYSYVNETDDDYYKHTIFWDSNKSDDAFVDTYALTYPTEDRARIFENVMRDSTWFDMSDYPMIIDKLNYFSEVIRAGFDTTGWPEKTVWEKYK